METKETYDFLKSRMKGIKDDYSFLSAKSDPIVFTALCIKNHFFKNPALPLKESDLQDMLVDGTGDGGVDAMFSDPSSESSDLVLCQSKFYQAITSDDVYNAMVKLIKFYKSMNAGNYEIAGNPLVQQRFLRLISETGEESKIHFILYTSAPKNHIKTSSIDKLMAEQFSNTTQFDHQLLFLDDVADEIRQAESRRPLVKKGELDLDESGNVLSYDEGDSAIVNVSAFSLKTLFVNEGIALLAKNLRYFVRKPDLDRDIKGTIQDDPVDFWLKNNGLTIICDDFKIDSKKLKLDNFSIVNGGQTTTLIGRSEFVNKASDFYIPCKVIRCQGKNPEERNLFTLMIAKAANSQKPIKPVDLKANSPEQVTFCAAMKNIGVFYQTKRGEEVPAKFSEFDKNSDLPETGKLCLAGLFQQPAKSRNAPSAMYQPAFYNPVFVEHPELSARFVKDLLYVDGFFRNKFIGSYNQDNVSNENLTKFANNARTICIAFVALASRYEKGNISDEEIARIFAAYNQDGGYDNVIYPIFKDLKGQSGLFALTLENTNKEALDQGLYSLFNCIIREGQRSYVYYHQAQPNSNETNFLKSDKNYYSILESAWPYLKEEADKQKDLFCLLKH